MKKTKRPLTKEQKRILKDYLQVVKNSKSPLYKGLTTTRKVY